MKIRFISVLLVIALAATMMFSMAACSNQSAEPDEPAGPVLTAVEMLRQGNPTTIYLSEIVEKDLNAWIKISTQYDSELSMYEYDSLEPGTCAIAVTFSVSDFDCGESTLYWCYQLVSGENTVAVWNQSSPTDTLTITADGKYMLVFDAQAALGGTLDTIESFQMVFPCGSETTNTKVSVSKVVCITDPAELQYFVTGPVTE